MAFVSKTSVLDKVMDGHEQVTSLDLNLYQVVVVIPCYNEERFIGSVVLKMQRHPVKVIVVDDGSTDDTAAVAESAGVTVIRQAVNSGKGAALNTGIKYARQLNPDVIAVIDADGQNLPEELPHVVAPILCGNADIVIGSRYLDNKSDVPLHRIWGHWLFNLIGKSVSGVSVTDSQSGYRAFSRKAYQQIDFQSKSFSVESEMQFMAHENHLRVVEVPIVIRYTDKPKRSPVSQGIIVLNGILQLTGQYRPLLFFGVPGTLMLLLGVLWGFIVVERFMETHQLAIGYAMICLLLSIFGLIMLSTGFTLHSIRGLLIEMRKSIDSHLAEISAKKIV